MPDESSSVVVSGASGTAAASPSSPASSSSASSNRSSPPTTTTTTVTDSASNSGGQAVSKKSQQQQLNGGIESKTSATTPTSVITNVNAAAARLNMLDNEDSWHIRYRTSVVNQTAGLNDENPLTTATAAMLNINGNDEHPHSMGLSIYDYYKIPGMEKIGGKTADIWHSDGSMEVSTIKMAGTNGQSHQRAYHTKSQSDRHSPDHPLRPSHHSSPSSDTDNSPHSTSPMSHAVVSSSTYSHSVKQESDGNSVIMKQEQHHELPPIHQAAFGVAYGNYGQAVPYVTALGDTQTVLLQAANGEYYRTPIAAPMDYGYGFGGGRPGQTGGHFQDPTEQMIMERYRQASGFAQNSINQAVAHSGLSVDLPSPDSGLGEALASREHAAQQMYEYNTNDMHGSCVSGSLMSPTTSTSDSPRLTPTPNNRRNSSVERTPVEKLGSANPVVNIPKVFSNVGFRYYLEAPISTSQKREEDRITYINKGQFYPITLEYIPDSEKPLKSQTVKSTIMLVFREEKTSEEEAKAWQFWHSRQHSIKQRIFDADTKNSQGLVGCIEETSHNAISVYWNPHEGHAKVNIAVQCLSTDFSNQKGVKGLPLHVQIDTHEDPRAQGKPVHRGYCQIKVFCDKGAERKTRDEERRAAKRKMAAAGRKKLDDLYHPPLERSEFYSMADLIKPPLLFTPADDLDRLPPMELSCFYSAASNTDSNSKIDSTECPNTAIVDNVLPPAKRLKTIPPVTERVMLYVRKDSDEVYTALHLVPPTLKGLAQALYLKYGIDPNKISKVYKKNFKGVTVEMDDDMLAFYSNEDSFVIDVHHTLSDDAADSFDIFLTEIIPDNRPNDAAHSSLNGTAE
ncbi:protein grainyhead-like isoform X2 [Paramacrobiotus metropolitanus]|uniref:protein grainyhead-like isoform X2 n=1 Tax=Paramacrobiotus metropolitanus TaxID=2943436 RepID=UPI0024458E22|nr:protein grainyhead-like isoform X2 [Paramacrobiotus metropolitanus]